MIRRARLLAALFTAPLLSSALPALVPQTTDRPQAQDAPVLVSTDWLSQRLTDSSVVVLHVGNQASFTQGHIPGARLMLLADFAPASSGLSTELPTADAFTELLRGAGVGSNSRIVVYGSAHPPTLAARLYVTLLHFGLGDRTSLLDGGLRAWRAEGKAVATEGKSYARGDVQLLARNDVIADHEWVALSRRTSSSLATTRASGTAVAVSAASAAGTAPRVAVLDARDTPFFTGAQQNTQRAARPGRISDAYNVVFSTVVNDEGKLVNNSALAALFAAAGVPPGGEVVTYCHVGQQASLLFVAAKQLGYKVRLYDGSYEDWSKRLELPVDTGGRVR